MTGQDFRAVRHKLGLSVVQFGRVLGYEGPHISSTIRRYEEGKRPVSPTLATLILMFERHGIPADILADSGVE